ncbi:hypothetical protein [Nocardia sp. NPDC051832]|uniref:hypothetical protein n=1 Tax=Nocardia sp. NPDC051832 TaxID=3155673 RepID=UPI00342D60A5
MTLLEVLAMTRRFIELPDNDFSWAGWADTEEALAEFDRLVAEVRRGGRPFMLRVLYAPTGPLQELSISSGWADEYVDLAGQFDRLF